MSYSIKTTYRTEYVPSSLESVECFCADRIGYVQAWKGDNSFTGCDMVNTCGSYFGALRTGYPLWEV